MEMVELHTISDYESLPSNNWNIKEPNDQITRESSMTNGLDLIIVPGYRIIKHINLVGVAFDKECNRIGHGKGYYDKFFAEYQSRHGKMPLLIGLSLECQIVECVPMETFDCIMDIVMTSTRYYRSESSLEI